MGLNHIVNGSPVEVKHINYGTAVGYTKVGSPTISDGVASGFSTSDYLHTPEFPFGDNSFEGFTKITMPDTLPPSDQAPGIFSPSSNRNGIVLANVPSSHTGLRIGFYTVATNDSSSVVISPVLDVEARTVYYVRFGWDKTKYYIDVSTDKTNWVSATRTSSSAPAFTNRQFRFGNTNYYGRIFGGSIDLNETYIKVNGKLWFYRPTTNYLVKDNKLVFADSGLYLSGPVNYEVVGNPTIVDNVASGFDGTSYLSLTNNLTALTNTYEMQVCIEDGAEITSTPYQRLLNFYKPNETPQLSIFGYTEDTSGISYFMQGVDYTDPDNPTSKQKRLLHNTSRNQKLVIRVISDGTSMTGSIYDATSGTLLAEEVEQGYFAIDPSLVTQIRIGNYRNSAQWKGKIDLNRTYVKINGSLWFYGKNYATQNIAPVPAGYPLGNTTTPSIGYVDMRTQAFTAAPTGATLGKDE